MIVTKDWMKRNYCEFNRKYFDGVLPMVKFRTSHSEHRWGYATYIYDRRNNTLQPEAITMSNYYDSPEKVKQNTLLHEMIHIYEYYTHPERFIRRSKHSRRYDAHGLFFQQIANRINRDGWNISKYVDMSAIDSSKMSSKTIKSTNKKINRALICVCRAKDTSFMFKTDVNKINKVSKTLHRDMPYIEIRIGKVNDVKYYKFDNPQLAKKSSCVTQLRGHFISNKKIDENLKNWNAEQIAV